MYANALTCMIHGRGNLEQESRLRLKQPARRFANGRVKGYLRQCRGWLGGGGPGGDSIRKLLTLDADSIVPTQPPSVRWRT